MKNLLLKLTIIGILFSCTNDDSNQNVINSQLFGKWKLVETLKDPGDGSGTFESIDSEKTIEFFSNGTFIINGPLCGLSTSVGENTKGNVRHSNNSERYKLVANEECEMDNSFVEYIILIEDSHLSIHYTACIEGCAQKYQKQNDE